jgi:hypothetical protein
MIVAGLIALETLLIVLSVFPAHRGPEIVRRFYFVPERRFGVIAAALTILVGVLMSVSMQ